MSAEKFEPGRWSLADLLPAAHGPEFDAVVGELESAVSELESHRAQLSPEIGTDKFLSLMDLVVKIAVESSRLRSYGYLWFAEDTQEQNALAFLGQVDKLLTDVQNRILFFTLWWKGLDDEPAKRLLAASGDNAYYLESERRFKPHTLSEPEEKVINIKDVNGVRGLTTIYDMITNAFTFDIEIDGETKTVSRSELMVYARDPRPEAREAAYRALYRVYGEEGTVLGQIYQYRVRDWASENLSLRGFASPIAARNLVNDIRDEVVDTLLEACRANAGLFQRYFRLKAGWLGVDKLRRYDIYAPLSASDKTFDFDQAVDLVLGSLQDFSPTLAQHARRVFVEGHLDSELRPRKDSGAFCASVFPGMTPWVLLNYTGRADDVATMAHELGHAIHALMASDHTPLTFHSSLPMAETASVFSEMLLLERLLAEEKDPAVRRDVLARFVDGAYATVMRQAYFVLFERDAHKLIAEGQTADQLSAHYLDNLREQFGDSLELGEEFRWEWTSVSHIYDVPFYCYAYSFGQLLVLALYKQYREEGETFIPRYEKILAYGGSRSPAEILSEAGIDIASLDFWNGGFAVIAEMIDELEALS